LNCPPDLDWGGPPGPEDDDSFDDPLEWGTAPDAVPTGHSERTGSPIAPSGPQIVVGDLDLSMMSLDELTELEDRQQNEGRQVRIALLMKDRDRRKAVWELGNKALMKVESLMRMMNMDEDAE
jgi:hypothetical protein